jgi:plasmid segregation protein ParM
VDVGHGWVKAVASDGRREMFPALLAPEPAGLDLGPLGNGVHWVVVRETGREEKYLMGEAASRLATHNWTQDKAADPATLALVLAATAMLDAQAPLELAVGLPLSWFGRQREALRQALWGRQASVRVAGREASIACERVVVCPQGVGAAVHALQAGAIGEPGYHLVVDVGYRTTDWLVVEVDRDGAPHGLADLAGTVEQGIHDVHLATARGLEADTGVSFREAELAGATVVAHGREVDLTPYRDAPLAGLTDEIARTVHVRMGDMVPKLRTVLLAGGGGQELAPRLRIGQAPHRVVPEPMWANALGFLRMLGC